MSTAQVNWFIWHLQHTDGKMYVIFTVVTILFDIIEKKSS
jgi:hypothetical protein